MEKLKSEEGRKEWSRCLQQARKKITNEGNNIEKKWDNIKEIMHSAAEEALGRKEEIRKEWISDITWDKIKQRKDIKGRINKEKDIERKKKLAEEYGRINKEVKKAARHDKRRWTESIAKMAEEASTTNNMRELYRNTKILSGKKYNYNKPLKSKDGELITTVDGQLKRWQQYYQELLQQPDTRRSHESNYEETWKLKIDIDKPTENEIKEAIQQLRNCKAAGIDEIPAELWKADIESAVNMLAPLIEEIWAQERTPAEWNNGIIVNLPKKGDIKECSNWRGITLLCSVNKIITRIIHQRIYEEVEKNLRGEQAGFRRGKSSIDQIATTRIIIEQTMEMNATLQLVFIDFEKAFDSVRQEALWGILGSYGIPHKIIRLIKMMYDGATCQVHHKGYLSEKIRITKGVKQGCILSPILFNICLDYVLRKVIGQKSGIVWNYFNNKKLADLEYADDICLVANTTRQAKKILENLEEEGTKIGLRINASKTKEMRIGRMDTQEILQVNGKAIQQVEEFCYLGSIINKHGGTEADIQRRIWKARQAFGALTKIWTSTQISKGTKIKIFNSNVKAVLLYACEAWAISKKNPKQGTGFHKQMPPKNLKNLLAKHHHKQGLMETY